MRSDKQAFESWSIEEGKSYLYTESKELAEALRRIYGRAITYERGGRVYAWQYELPTKRVQFFLRLFESPKSENPSIENKEVTGTKLGLFPIRKANASRVRVSTGRRVESCL